MDGSTWLEILDAHIRQHYNFVSILVRSVNDSTCLNGQSNKKIFPTKQYTTIERVEII